MRLRAVQLSARHGMSCRGTRLQDQGLFYIRPFAACNGVYAMMLLLRFAGGGRCCHMRCSFADAVRTRAVLLSMLGRAVQYVSPEYCQR